MSIRGQRFELNLDEDHEQLKVQQPVPAPLTGFIGDIHERKVQAASSPKPPQSKAANGFPSHRNRLSQSRFKSARSEKNGDSQRPSQAAKADPVPPKLPGEASILKSVDGDRKDIDQENRQRLAQMSDAEIEQERQELLDSINPSLLQGLLRRAKLDDGNDHSDFPGLRDDQPSRTARLNKPRKKVTFEPEQEPQSGLGKAKQHDQATAVPTEETNGTSAEDGEFNDVDDAEHVSVEDLAVTAGSIHFPRPEQPPELDPSSPSFLEDLHKKYFPSLPADPDKLEWMRPSSGTSSYSPHQASLDAKDIRFGFDGTLIAPSKAARIPVTAGLHHHGDAPEAAGYTIPELATLARSSVASQRCIAFQTLGRVLYRLGKGEFGDPSEGGSDRVVAEDTLGELARGLWAEVEKERVVDICTAESDGRSMAGGKHVSAQAYATEAVWLWQKGGGRRWRTD